jgi:S1-C subfamily serine protease
MENSLSQALTSQLIKRGLGALGIGFLGVVLARQIDPPAAPGTPPPPPILPDNTYLPDEKNNIEVFHRAAPSVVHISSIAIQRNFFSYDTYEVPQGSGTGFVWDHKGHIVTNLHVITQNNRIPNRIVVRTMDQEDHLAEFIGGDPHKDLAVLKIDLPANQLVPLGRINSETSIRVGQKALAIGNPFGLDHTLTTGVVSALEREITSLSQLKIFGVIQTDAAINPGNSGGPLLNAQGRLIGVNTQIMSKSGSSAGIGFAIPADVVNYVIPQLIQHGRVTRVGLGVNLLEDHITRRLGIKRGVLIYRLTPNGAAASIGLRGITFDRYDRPILGDAILAIDDRKVNNRKDLLDQLINYRLGDKVELTILRNGQTLTLSCPLQAIKD